MYGSLATPALIHSNCSFALMAESSASEVQRRAFAALGRLPPVRGMEIDIPESKKPKDPAGWMAEWVLQQHIFFSPWLYREGDARWAQRGTVEHERVAVEWAAAGVVSVGDITASGGSSHRLLTALEFAERFPSLDASILAAVAEALPLAWLRALRTAPAITQTPTEIVVTPRVTLIERAATPIASAPISHLYACLIAANWELPTAMRAAGHLRRAWEKTGRPERAYRSDASRLYAGLRQKCVPSWLSDDMYRAATGTDVAHWARARGCARCGASTASGQHRHL